MMGITRRAAMQALSGSLAGMRAMGQAPGARPPNFVLIFLDDSGWADFHPFGKTPTARRTSNGSPAKAAISQLLRHAGDLLGLAIVAAERMLSGPHQGLRRASAARARARSEIRHHRRGPARRRGYRTAVFGKWHIGDQPETRPPARGFDESCGLMYSNDMWEFHPETPKTGASIRCSSGKTARSRSSASPRSTSPCSPPGTPSTPSISSSATRSNPFLLYVPHSMPHVPIFASEKFKGKSGTGLYGDVMMEIDWSVGEMMKALHDARASTTTRWSSSAPTTARGSSTATTPARRPSAKPRPPASTAARAARASCAIRARSRPGTISKQAFCTVDMLPTMAHLAGAKLPDESDRRQGRVGPHHRQAGREESARLLSVLHRQGLRRRHQRRRPLEAAHPAQLPARCE